MTRVSSSSDSRFPSLALQITSVSGLGPADLDAGRDPTAPDELGFDDAEASSVVGPTPGTSIGTAVRAMNYLSVLGAGGAPRAHPAHGPVGAQPSSKGLATATSTDVRAACARDAQPV